MIWWFYHALKDYKLAPCVKQAQLLRAVSTGSSSAPAGYARSIGCSDGCFATRTAPARSRTPEIPINTNSSENDIRAFVTKEISGGTVSDKGRDARDIMLGLPKPA